MNLTRSFRRSRYIDLFLLRKATKQNSFDLSGFLESPTNSSKLVLPDDQIPFFQDFLTFCYAKPLEIDLRSRADFYKAEALQILADRLQVQDLVGKLESFWQKVKEKSRTWLGRNSHGDLRSFQGNCPPAIMIFSVYFWLEDMGIHEIQQKLSVLPHRFQTEIIHLLGPMNEFNKHKTSKMSDQDSLGSENKRRKT